ncbi:hypothetical protein [Thermus sp.]|uniref:hypothetical protein n=1 Tax=Thermus sp. TaxID=275 RepID=UPI00351B9508
MGKRGFPRREPNPKEVLTHRLRSKDQVLRYRRGEEVRRVRWGRGRKLLWPFGGSVGAGYASDTVLGAWALGRFGPCGERKPRAAMVRAFLELLAYGLRVLFSLPPPPGYKAIC